MPNPTDKQPTDLITKVKHLIQQQKSEWGLARENYAGLNQIQSKAYDFGDFQLIVQFNPARIRSSAAETDTKSIQQRPCFLCEKNRPQEQQLIEFNSSYSILVNPFPIFNEHLTIPLNNHQPQEISTYFDDLLKLSRELAAFTIFYNGPKSGASAPDHFHFQAGNKNLMPVGREIKSIAEKYGECLARNEMTTVRAVGNEYLRKVVLICSASPEDLIRYFKIIFNSLEERGQEGEPMLNLLVNFENNSWQVVLFPRDKQRPSQFFAEGRNQILVSPASVEMGGLVILPRKEDFEKLTKDDLMDIYQQVTMNDNDFEQFKEEIKKRV